MSMKVISKGDECLARKLDESLKNKFKFEWLEAVVDIESKTLGKLKVKVGDSIQKVNVRGKALCSYCKDILNYGGKGKSALVEHLKSGKHVTQIEHRRTNYTLSGEFAPKKQISTPLFPLFKKITPAPSPSQPPTTPLVTEPPEADKLIPVEDRTKNMEAMILSMMAENNISFTVAPEIVKLITECARDPKALARVSLTRCTAAYKLKYGLADYFKKAVIACMKECPFSLNIDEATSANNKKVLAVLVSYFSPVKNEIVIEHLASVELIKTDAASIFNAVKELIEGNEIPWTNLQSCLLDSCNVMRGEKSGFETRLRQVAPHLLDIDGDSCHHIHNAVKKFCEPFEGWVERLFYDLHTDFKWSTDSRDLMSELCFLFDTHYTVQPRFIPHRWLSAYDVALSTLRLYEIYRIFYFPFLDSQASHKKEIHALINKLPSLKAQDRVHSIMELLKLKYKSMTKDGKQRKQRIVQRLFHNNVKTSLILNFYISALPMLKQYVCLFQTQTPMIHKLHDAQLETTKQFLASFIQPSIISEITVDQLVSLDVGAVANNLELHQLFVGKKTGDLLENYDNKSKNQFLILTSRAYRSCAKYLLSTLPLKNRLIVSLSALDPEAPCHIVVRQALNSLANHFNHYLSSEESEAVVEEIKNFTATRKGKEFKDERVDVWWSRQNKYPVLQKLSRACLSIFHGPMVEGSFSTMKDIIKTKSGNMNISTFSAIQTIKYSLRSRNVSAVECFKRPDTLHTPVDPVLVNAISKSASRYKSHTQQLREQAELKRKDLDMKLTAITTKAKAKSVRERAVKRAFSRHIKSVKKKTAAGDQGPPAKKMKC